MLHLKSNIITTSTQLHTLSFRVNYSFDLLIAQLCDFIYITVSVMRTSLLYEGLVGVCFAVVAACSGLYVVCAGNSSGIPEVEFLL